VCVCKRQTLRQKEEKRGEVRKSASVSERGRVCVCVCVCERERERETSW